MWERCGLLSLLYLWCDIHKVIHNQAFILIWVYSCNIKSTIYVDLAYMYDNIDVNLCYIFFIASGVLRNYLKSFERS